MEAGVRHYKKALLYNSHYADAMYNLGVAYGETLRFDEVGVARLRNGNRAIPPTEQDWEGLLLGRMTCLCLACSFPLHCL